MSQSKGKNSRLRRRVSTPEPLASEVKVAMLIIISIVQVRVCILAPPARGFNGGKIRANEGHF